MRLAIIWTNAGIVYWRIYASLAVNELTSYIPLTVDFLRIFQGLFYEN